MDVVVLAHIHAVGLALVVVPGLVKADVQEVARTVVLVLAVECLTKS